MVLDRLKNKRARLLAVAACGLVIGAPAFAQQTAPDPTELDPDAPMDAMPDLGVDWPDMNAPDPAPLPDSDPLPDAAPDIAEAEPEPASVSIDDSVAARRYAVRLEGLGAAGDETLLDAFAEQSALDQEDGKPANAATIDRRARADSELLVSLLQAQGYYDAEVEPGIALEGDLIAVSLRAVPGPRYQFEAVDFPGLAEAGGDAESLREAFAVKPGDPVVAEKVDRRRGRAEGRAGRAGLRARPNVGDAGHRHRS